jgi:hypothetical protein
MNFFPNTHLTHATALSYNNKIAKWISIMPEHKNTLRSIYTNPNFSVVQLRKYLTQHNTDTAPTLNSYIKAVLSASEHNSDMFFDVSDEKYDKSTQRWKELRQKTYEYANSYRLEQRPSPTQSTKLGSTLTFTDIERVRDELPDDSIDKLLLGFYTYIPPVRADFFSTELVKSGVNASYPNYIEYDDNKSYMVITDFKTKDVYESIEYQLPSELHRLLSESLKSQPRQFLFVNKFGNCFKRKTFSDWASKRLSDLFQKQFTLTMFRHIYISGLDIDTSGADLLDISNKMGHSITQQMLYRWKERPECVMEVD